MDLKAFILALFLAALPGAVPLAEAGGQTVTDEAGRQVSVPDDPRRIVSLAPSITEILFALQQEHRLQGVTQFSDYPPEAREYPKVGSYVRLDLERIVALQPDLCVAIRDGNPREVVERLERLGIPVYVVNPKDLEGIMHTILRMGRLLGAGEQAEALVEDMAFRIQKVKDRVAGHDHRPGVFFQIGLSPIVSVGSESHIHQLIELAGGKNLTEGPTLYPRFSFEQVLHLAPDIIILTSMTRGVPVEEISREWGQWPNLPAVRNGRVLVVDSNLFDRPSPRLVDGLELLADLIHPEPSEKAP